MRNFWIISFLIYCSLTFSQKTMQGQIIDFDTTIPIAFAKISYNNNTYTSNWEGKFSLEIINDKKPILFSYKGYYDKNYYLSNETAFLLIKMIF